MTPLAIFLGSALLFCLQPMVGRTLLPAFGGSAAVWSVCLGTFQALLVGGYAYAHTLGAMGAARQRRLHVALLALAVAWAFAIALAGLGWARGNLHAGRFPALEVLLVVLLGAGVPYLVLSAGSSLLQAWAAAERTRAFSENGGGGARGVYRLYAVSNLGSFLGLFAYPFLLDPFVPLRWQWMGWSAGLAVYLALVAGVALRRGPQEARPDPMSEDALDRALAEAERAGGADAVALPRVLSGAAWWYVLPGASSFMLLAITNHLSMDVAPMPLLWAILLGAFLLSYVAGFSRAGERLLPLWRALAVAALIGCGYAAHDEGGDGFAFNIGAGTAAMFFCGTFLHGWLYAIRPEGARLTRFYLGIAIGGAIGGLSVSFLAPVVFDGYWEYPVALAGCALLALFFIVYSYMIARRRTVLMRLASGVTALACVWAGMMMWAAARGDSRNIVLRERNFYGSLKVAENTMAVFGATAEVRSLSNGGTLHGQQAHGASPDIARKPTTYYSLFGGGLALALNAKWKDAAAVAPDSSTPRKVVVRETDAFMPLPKGRPMRVGAVGLGIGTMAVWGREGDVWHFFEINPLVVRVARDERFFTCLSGSPATMRVSTGDARLLLERERAARSLPYDVLIVDAYTGDSVPLHLATREAFQLYASRLAPGGVLAMHVSNWHMDLLPLAKAAARELGMRPIGVQSDGDDDNLVEGALWVFLMREPVALTLPDDSAQFVDFSKVRDIRLPTDNWGSLQELIRFNYTIPLLAGGGAGEEPGQNSPQE